VCTSVGLMGCGVKLCDTLHVLCPARLYNNCRVFTGCAIVCDVCRRTSSPGAVTHSGDIMEFENQKGHNHARINFAGLGPRITQVFITLSGWSQAQLSDIMAPYVQLVEPKTGVCVCGRCPARLQAVTDLSIGSVSLRCL